MSNAAVKPQMRVRGWNVHLLAGPTGLSFAGLYLHDNNDSLTYRDILSEILLCFHLPINNVPVDSGQERTGQLALARADAPTTSFIHDSVLDQVVPSPVQTAARYHLVRHRPCTVSDSSSFIAHLQAGCAEHVARPKRRRDPRYLPPKKASNDPRITRFPLRCTVKSRKGSQSPPKRSASGTVSPRKGSDLSQQEYDEDGHLDTMVAPPELAVSVEVAREIVSSFRYNCLIEGEQCAVTSRGRSWCNIPIGPAVQACHIIPQQHYHLYPDPEGLGESLDDLSVLYSPARLQAAWQRTWSAENGILLFSHLHELFDMRLFSIHPDTLRIRAFVPYDILLDYHGRTSQVPAAVDRSTLRHHYEMSCIENMGSMIPLMDQTSSDMSGAASPFGERVNVPSLLSARPPDTAGNSAEPSDSQMAPGDPSKRCRSAQDDNEYPSSTEAKTPSSAEHVSPGLVLHPTKRRRSSCGVGRDEGRWDYGAMFDGCITKENSVEFLADVNWELKRAVLVGVKDEPLS